jgi:uncharacterized membrane protein
MDTLTILIVLALVATVVTMLMGIFSMGAGGATDEYAGERLMWTRVGLQALAVLLMGAALLFR